MVTNFLTSARRALQWRLLLLWAACMLAPSALLALPVWAMLGDSVDYSVHGAALAQQLDMTAVADLMASHGKNSALFGYAGKLALLATLALSPLLTGMAACAARAPQAPGFRALIGGALAEYPRMLRMLVWALLLMGLLALAARALKAAVNAYGEDLVVASDLALAGWLAAALVALLALLLHASLDAGRAVLTLERQRSSALLAWWSACALLARRPLALLLPYAALGAVGLGVAAPLGLARLAVSGASVPGFVLALLLTQLVVLAIGWMRVARLFALADAMRARPAPVRAPHTAQAASC